MVQKTTFERFQKILRRRHISVTRRLQISLFPEDPADLLDPFPGVGVEVGNCTTAGLPNLIFPYVHLKSHTIGITREKESHSEIAKEYLAIWEQS